MEPWGKLRRLWQSSGTSNYIKEFTTLTFKIEDLFDKGALFFMDGLQNWVTVELENCGVETLDATISDTELLNNFSFESMSKKPHSSKSGEDKSRQKK